MPEAKTLSNENSPINANKAYAEPSVFLAENLLREARRQKNITQGQIPAVCVLDPDGDIGGILHFFYFSVLSGI